MMGRDELPMALAPVGLPAWSGIAILDDEGDGTTTVSVYLFEGPGIDTGAIDHGSSATATTMTTMTDDRRQTTDDRRTRARRTDTDDRQPA